MRENWHVLKESHGRRSIISIFMCGEEESEINLAAESPFSLSLSLARLLGFRFCFLTAAGKLQISIHTD